MKKIKACFFYLQIICIVSLGFQSRLHAQVCRGYANQQNYVATGLSSVTNPDAPIGFPDTTDNSTITPVLLATIYQNLVFPATAQANTPVVLKLSGINFGSGLANSVIIQAYNDATAVGTALTGTALANMLSSNGNSRIRFAPTAAYNTIRVSINTTLSLGFSINLFYAYQEVTIVPAFTINQATQYLEGNSYTFTNTSAVNSGSLTYLWNFGDGTATSTTTSPTHVYTTAGTYAVTLTATGISSCASVVTQNVTVAGGTFTGSLTGLPFYFTGAAGADWGTATNWRVLSGGYFYIPGSAPAAGNPVFIGVAASTICTLPVQPSVTIGSSTTALCANLNLGSSAVLQLSGSLTISGNLNDASAGTFGIRGATTGNLIFNSTGSATSLRFATGYQLLSSLQILRTNGASAAVTLTSPLAIYSYVNLASNNILDSQSGNLTLKSLQAVTASVYTLPTGAVVKGTVNAERFFYAGGNPSGLAAYRSYRLISSPVSNTTYNYSGSQAAPVYNLNYLKAGSFLTGAANGNFDKTGNPTLYLYREDVSSGITSFTNGNFKGISKIDPASNNIGTQSRFNTANVQDTTIQLAAGNGVLFFFRGDRTNLNGKTVSPFTVPQDVTFTNTGVLNQGNILANIWFKPTGKLSYTSSSSISNAAILGFNLIGNPYACTIDWNTNSTKTTVSPGIVFSAATDVDTKMYVFDPLAKTYTWFDSSIGTNGGNDGNPNGTRYIASGQGFFVRAKNTSATLTFTENAKANNQTSQPSPVLLGLPKPAADALAAIKIRLKLDSVNYDYAAIYFNQNWKENYDVDEDAPDLDGNGNTVNLSTFSADQKRLAINKMPFLTDQARKIPLYVKGNSGKYELLFTELANIPAQFKVYLKDNFTVNTTELNSNYSYVFQIDQNNQDSFGEKRFELVFKLQDSSAYRLISFKGSREQQEISLNWTTENEGNYTSFTIEKSMDGGKTFTGIASLQSDFSGTYYAKDKTPFTGNNIYRLKQDDLFNRITYSDLVNVWIEADKVPDKTFMVYPNPAINLLNVKVLKDQKALVRSRILNMQGIEVASQESSSLNWILNIQRLVPGVYTIELRNVKSGTIIGQSKFVKK